MRRARESVARELAAQLLVDLRERILARAAGSATPGTQSCQRRTPPAPARAPCRALPSRRRRCPAARAASADEPRRTRRPGCSRTCWRHPRRGALARAARSRAGTCRAAPRRPPRARLRGRSRSLRGDRSGRIDAHPAPSFEPDFRPGVRIRLTDDQVAAHRVVFAALIAGDHARRDAGGTRQHRERGREVLAETAARVEQEIVDRIQFQPRRLERVEVFLVAKLGEHRCDECRVAPGALAHFARQRDRALLRPAGSRVSTARIRWGKGELTVYDVADSRRKDVSVEIGRSNRVNS